MNGESVLNTPSSSISKKRELTSPDFDIESKKNKLLSASSESDLDSTMSANISITDKQTVTDSEAIMALATSTPLPVEEVEGASDAPHITIPPSEMMKIAEMLKETFRGEIESMVDSVVKGVLKGLQERITVLEKTNAELQTENKALTS